MIATTMISVWYLSAACAMGLIGIVAALWKGGEVCARVLAKRPFWIVTHHHRFGVLVFPVFCKNRPDLAWLLANDSEFNADYEGHRTQDEDGRDDGLFSAEWIDITGPWYVGVNNSPSITYE